MVKNEPDVNWSNSLKRISVDLWRSTEIPTAEENFCKVYLNPELHSPNNGASSFEFCFPKFQFLRSPYALRLRTANQSLHLRTF